MSKLTIQQQLAVHFDLIGEKEIKGKSSKFRVFTRTRNADGTAWTSETYNKLTTYGQVFWYLGKAGALRTGHNASTSITMESVKRRILQPVIKAVSFVEKTAQE
jgi:hypothetical protein